MTETMEKIAPPYDSNRVYQIPLMDVEADSDWNCRGHIDPMSLIELAESIDTMGLQQPVIVMPNIPRSGEYRQFKLVAGYRRYAAHRMKNKATIDAVIKIGLNETDARVLNLTENLQREQLNIKQEAHAINHLRFLTQEDIMQRLGKSRGWVQTRMYVLRLPDDLQDEAAMGNMSVSEIRNCAMLQSNEDKYEYYRQLKAAKLKGNVKLVDPKRIENRSGRALRSGAEIEEMIEHVHGQFGHNIGTRLLAWAAGNIDLVDLEKSLAEEGIRQHVTYRKLDGGY